MNIFKVLRMWGPRVLQLWFSLDQIKSTVLNINIVHVVTDEGTAERTNLLITIDKHETLPKIETLP